MECRDWLSTLWQASFRGFHFYFESDDEDGGRGLVIHEFPHRDHPFIEDMGEAPRFYEGRAYVHGDNADALAAQFTDALASRGAATLVVPIRGPVRVHAQSFKRHHQRDRLGYVAFQVKFVREGASSALIPVSFAAGAAYAAADRAATALAEQSAQSLLLDREPDHVIAAAADGLLTALAALDVMRETQSVAPLASASLRDRIADAIDTLPDAIQSAPAPALPLAATSEIVSITRALADAMPPAIAAHAMTELAESFAASVNAPAYPSRTAQRAAVNAAAASRLMRLAAMIAYAESVMRADYVSRQEGVTARGDVSARFERELSDTSGAAGNTLYIALTDLQGAVVDYLSRVVADLAPVITLEANRKMPALFWSYRLYGDAMRAGELVARNRVPHPAFMPETFQALAF